MSSPLSSVTVRVQEQPQDVAAIGSADGALLDSSCQPSSPSSQPGDIIVGTTHSVAHTPHHAHAAHDNKNAPDQGEQVNVVIANASASKEGTYRNTTLSLHPETLRFVAYCAFWTMVLLATFVTKVFVKKDLTNSPLVKMFGYNNICIMWDYEPATSVIAMFYPVVEVPLVGYVALNALRVREAYRSELLSRHVYRVCCVLVPIEITLVLWFRMIFVIHAFDDVMGHTLGFHGLMIALCLVALQNFLYMDSINSAGPHKGTALPGGRAISITYLCVLYSVTIVKLMFGWSIFAGTPMWKIGTPAGNRGAQFLDVMWMILASLIPAWLAWRNRKITPAMDLAYGLETDVIAARVKATN